MFLASYEKHRLVGLTKFKRLKHKNSVALVNIGPNSGPAYVSITKHVDVWMLASYDPVANTASVVGLGDYEAA